MDGFCDLRPRAHTRGHDSETSFWPSFTDLMMVVVMIFLITTSVLYLQNWQLVQEMSSLMEAEKIAREAAQQSAREQGAHVSALERNQQALLSQQSDKQALESELAETRESLRVVTQMRDAIHRRDARQQQDHQALQQRARDADLQIASQQKQLNELQLTVNKQMKPAVPVELLAELDNSRAALSNLQATHAALEAKYNKLIRPARSAKGRTVVTLRHGKAADALYYDLQLPGESTYTRVIETELHRQLQIQLSEHGDKLYLKLVYPRTSGLSYDEAFKFRNSVLNRYDYYYSKRPLSESQEEQ